MSRTVSNHFGKTAAALLAAGLIAAPGHAETTIVEARVRVNGQTVVGVYSLYADGVPPPGGGGWEPTETQSTQWSRFALPPGTDWVWIDVDIPYQPAATVIAGDTDGNGRVGLEDVILDLQILAGGD